MQLSRTERWILSNQYRILELLDQENAESHRNAREALDDGFEMYYGWLCEHVLDGEEVVTEEESKYVIDVLDMFNAMQQAYDDLADRSGIDTVFLTFPGFSANYEGKFLRFARYFCRERNAYESLRKSGDGLDSHMPTDDFYPRMLKAWKQSANTHDLSKADLIRIMTTVRPDRES